MMRIFFIVLISLLTAESFGQYNWKLEKDQDGIKVYSSDIQHSVFKAIKVECTLTGSYTKLISVLTNVPQLSNWVYHAKNVRLLKQNSPSDILYYTETQLPWPLANRDAVIHLRIRTDSLPKVLNITGTNEPAQVPKVPDKVRVSHYFAKWRVTMPTANTIRIYYEIEVDPGGSIPGWIANMFASKGPYETFINLAKKLKE